MIIFKGGDSLIAGGESVSPGQLTSSVQLLVLQREKRLPEGHETNMFPSVERFEV